jgi:hypothetical protein
LNWQFPPAAIDQHAQEDAGRPAEVGQLIERSAHSASGITHIIDNDHSAIIDAVDRQPGLAQNRTRPDRRQIVAIECDVQSADWRTGSFGALDLISESISKLNASALHTNENQVGYAGIELDDLTSHTGESALHCALIHQELSRGLAHLLPCGWKIGRKLTW